MGKLNGKGFYDDVEDCVASLRQIKNIYNLEGMGFGNTWVYNENGHFIFNYYENEIKAGRFNAVASFVEKNGLVHASPEGVALLKQIHPEAIRSVEYALNDTFGRLLSLLQPNFKSMIMEIWLYFGHNRRLMVDKSKNGRTVLALYVR